MDTNPLEALNNQMSNTLDTFRENNVIKIGFKIIVVLIQFWISSLAIIWSSVFIYLMIYYNYIPVVSTTRDVFIQYHSTCDRSLRDNICNVPTARVALKQSRSTDFMRGQMYGFSIDLHLPESEVNWSQGLFMVRLKLVDQKQRVIANVAKPTGLRYKSTPLRVIVTLLYWPLFVLGLAEENQQITVDLIDDYTEGSYPKAGPIHEAIIEFEARDVQIYPPTVLKVRATLTGFRYYMHNYKVTSFVVGSSTIASFLYFISFFAFANYLRINYNNNNQDNNRDDNTNTNIAEQLNRGNRAQRIEAIEHINEDIDQNEAQDSGLTGEIEVEVIEDNNETNEAIEANDHNLNTSSNSDEEETEQIPDSSIG